MAMAVAMNRSCSNVSSSGIVTISYPDSIKIHVLSFLWGVWCLFKKILRSAWWYNGDTQLQRDSPPACLIDTSLGQHSYVKLKGVKLHYVEAGNKDGPVLLFLHGFPDCWIGWRYQIPVLAVHYRVVVLDLKGFGDSDKPVSRRNYRLDLLLAEITDLITALGVQSCSIVGHDLGALLGWFMVHLYPHMVNKFVAISCPHPNLYWTHLPNTSSFNTSWIHYSQLPLLPELDAMRDDLNIINRCYQHLTVEKFAKPYLDAYKYSFSRKEDWTGPINYFRNLPFWRVTVDESESSIMVPCLMIVGNQDSSVKLESIIKTTDFLEKFSVKVIDGANHFPHQEYPQEVNKSLINFLVGNKNKECAKQESPSGGLVYRMFGVVSSTMKYGNQVIYDIVQKRSNGITTTKVVS